MRGAEILLQSPVRVVDPTVKGQRQRALLQRIDGNLLQERDRIVAARLPPGRIELPKQAGRFVVPAPPQVVRELSQSLARGRDDLPERTRLVDDRSHLRTRRHEHAHVVLREGPGLCGLDDQDALKETSIDDRHA